MVLQLFHGGPGASERLGAELRRLRLELGISQRKLTKLIGLSAHSNLGEYERGSRIPPGDIVLACERLLSVPPGHLQRLRKLALRERARARCWPYGRPAREG
jgi:transcriptional regulator with XRE-family HTH domain